MFVRCSPAYVLQVQDQICKLAKKGMTPSAIGVLLRDQHGIPQVTTVTGSKILRILKGSGLAPDIPEDLYFLIKKAVSMRKHLERNRKDKDGKFRLILIESRIHRLARYYKVQNDSQVQQPQQQDCQQCSVVMCGAHGCAHCCPALGPMLVEVASGSYPGVFWWLAAHAAARHCQHPGCGAPGSSCVQPSQGASHMQSTAAAAWLYCCQLSSGHWACLEELGSAHACK
jgi:ribosomal protein S15P/S13E